ncbi:MAG: riboflavin biosynthesis protein RibF [Firmicutes bacterium]|nr:riboflavin biosynthesis protein RibF [Bacillota bacterium]
MKELISITKPIALALGYFDSIHFAHRKIISSVVEFSRINNYKSAVLTFSNNLPDKSSPIYAFSDRKNLLSELEVDYLIPYRFDENFKSMSPLAFLQMLFSTFDIKYIACGFDYRFGLNGEGDGEFLKEFAKNRGASVKIFNPIKVDGQIVSTTLIKESLLKGDIKLANNLLVNPYFIEGRVTRGKGRGAALGYPTANIKPADKFLPSFGVYKSRVTIDGKVYPSLTSIGNKPTFSDNLTTVESFIDGNVFNLYSKTIKIELLSYIRELKKFDSAAGLKEQIKKDISKNIK